MGLSPLATIALGSMSSSMITDYGDGARYPGQLVLQDVLALHGRQFKDAALILASPPCQEYSYMAMPWSKAKAIEAEYLSGKRDPRKLTALFDACFRIQREACEAAGRHIPMVVENVRGAQKWVGRSRWNFGSFHLWGDVPALMPIAMPALKMAGGDAVRSAAGRSAALQNYDALRAQGTKLPGNNAPRRWADREIQRLCDAGGVKQVGDWFNASSPSMQRRAGSKSKARKAASATIAKIPPVLAFHVAKMWFPKTSPLTPGAR